LIRRRHSFSQWVRVKPSDEQWNPWGAGTSERRGAPPVKLIRTWVWIIGLVLRGRRGDWSPPRDPQITLPGVKLDLLGLGSRAKVCKTPPELGRLNTYWVLSPARYTRKKKARWVKCKKPPVFGRGWGLSSSLRIATAEGKGWITKIQFQTRRLTIEQMNHPPFHQIAL
jgi:hypothetical protein